mmetsp:Transcript_15103/g.42601  ORF Transcript_15103/g.42601 Transcript_15103/m.42601 type:complete len:125 (+) Transcript_15103:109-483(+)|eukprot:CAMPEP_0119562314 /NCGR_PEP_ID=MMETSP1352-20130426/20028_1 /TAXON_ID=265584 /ORGANISM="Stauroneis constricta, Strain CCMP1120" /LENGTH=124 /DNA_ID=CAMNT_0007610683 /DNA_START=99 /DNA_END=473 /DNA_ORIENTATION=-
MPFWGGGSEKKSAEQTFASDDVADFQSGSNFAASGGGGGGGGAGMQELQQMSMAIQQQMIVQQVINDLTDRSYEKCITSKPSDSLNGTQVACIKSTVNKWLDTNEFMTGRLAKKSQAQQGGGLM